MPTYQGKIGILPDHIREELNHRLLDGQPGSKILPWLNALPEVKRLLKENDEGLLVTDQNLSKWRAGGFADWRRRREQIARVGEMAKWSMQLAKTSGGNLTEGAAAILSGRILQVLEGVDSLLNPDTQDLSRQSSAPGGAAADQTALSPAQFTAVTAAISELTDSLATLRAGDQENRRLAEAVKRTAIMEGRLKVLEGQLAIAEEKARLDAIDGFIKWAGDEQSRAIATGNLPHPEKIAKLRQAFFADVDALEKSPLPIPA